MERGGNIHRRVIANISAKTLKGAIQECVAPTANVMTDEFPVYRKVCREFASHSVISHGIGEYSRGGVSTNTAESSFALIKRGLMGIYHAVSKEHLHRYLGEFDFRWNTRKLDDGERTVLAVEGARGKRLDYETCVA